MPGRPALAQIVPERIALIKPSALGDILNTLPVLTALRWRYPGAHITWIVNRGYEPLLRGHPHLDATLAFDRGAHRRGWWQGVSNFGRFLARLHRERFDLVLDLQGLFRSGLMAGATCATRRVGLAGAREGAAWFYTDLVGVPNRGSAHAVDRNWQMARAFGIEGEPPAFWLPLAHDARDWGLEAVRDLPRPWLMVAPGSRWLTKRWPPEHFATLIQRAQAQFGGSAVFVGSGNDEVNISKLAREKVVGPTRDFTGRTTLPELAALLARADVVLANDTGPLHLAVALGRPVVAPYTCTKIALNGPYKAIGGGVESRVWCQGSYQKRCGRMECMAELTPDRLWPVLEEVLCRWQSPRVSA